MATFTGIRTQHDLKTAHDQARSGDVIIFAEGDCPAAFDTVMPGLTYRGSPNRMSRLIYDDTIRPKGSQLIGIYHDDITIEGLTLDGERKSTTHGVLRAGTCRRLTIRYNVFVNAGNSHINLGGSIKNATISHVEIYGNVIRSSGYGSEYGEAIYLGDFEGSGSVSAVNIFLNEIADFTDNGIDLKPPVRNVGVFENYIHTQTKRYSGQVNTGCIVAQGNNIRVNGNAFENIDGGSSLYNLNARAAIHVYENVVLGVQSQYFVRNRGSNNTTDSIVENNALSDMSTTGNRLSSGLVVRNNTEIPRAQAQVSIDVIKSRVADECSTEPGVTPGPEPEPVIDLAVDRISWGELGSNVVRVYVRDTNGDDIDMASRTLTEGVTRFVDVSNGQELALQDERLSLEGQDPGARFRLAPGHPTGPIQMIAPEHWMTGAEAINAILPYHNPDAPDYTVLQKGDIAFYGGDEGINVKVTRHEWMVLAGGEKRYYYRIECL